MDEPPDFPAPHYRIDGFDNQRLVVLPRPLAELALTRPGTRRLTVTDVGYFPAAAGHRRVRPHGAPETIILLCVAGDGMVSIDGRTYPMTRGACVLIPALVPHIYETSPADPWTIWWVHLRGSDVAEMSGSMLGAPRPLTRLRAVDRVIALFDELLTLMERRLSQAHLLTASGLAWQLLTRIEVDSVLPADGSPLERAMRYLETRVDGTIRVGELARLVGLSPSHLGSLFRKATGGGPGAFHTSLKMARARDLLDTTELSIANVSLAVGYADPLYFSRHFRQVHGMNPSTYRAQHKG